MKLFTFLLMMGVAVGGGLAGYRMITGKELIRASDFGIATSADVVLVPAPTAGAPVPTHAPAPTVAPAPTAAPAATATPTVLQGLVVANTGGLGVYTRRTPHMDDKLRAWMDGTKMDLLQSGIQSDGIGWMKVRSPDGAESYVPQQYLR